MRPILIALAASALAHSAAAQTIVVDPEDNPAVTARGAVPPLAPPPLLNLPALQTELVIKAGSDRVRFDLYGAELNDAARATLLRQAEWIRLNPFVRISIEGHADGRLTRDTALALGERRAAAVMGFLLAQGIPPEQLTVTSWGKERPAAPAVHEAAWLQNSRVQLVLVR